MTAFIGQCPACHGWDRLNGDGTMKSHPPHRLHDPYQECAGTRFAPLETIPLEEDSDV